MRKKYEVMGISLLIILFLCPSRMFPQQQKQVVRAKSEVPALSFFVSGSYFTPKFTEVNAEYQTIEKIYALPQGKDFKTPYFAIAGIRFTPGIGQSIQAEFGGSVLKSPQPNATNFLQLYYTGLSYLVSIPLPMISVYGGGGLGYSWLNTQRTYTTNLGIAQINGQLGELHGMVGIEFFDVSGVSFALEGRYIYSTTIRPTRADLDFTQKGLTGGIRIGVPLIM